MSKKQDAEVDISGLVGNTAIPTVFALSNSIKFSVVIPASLKKKMLAKWRIEKGASRDCYFRLYISGLTTLLTVAGKRLGSVIIDTDFYHHDRKISLWLHSNRDLRGLSLFFRATGRKSPAHELALKVYRREKPADKVVSMKELEAQVFGKIKKDRGSYRSSIPRSKSRLG